MNRSNTVLGMGRCAVATLVIALIFAGCSFDPGDRAEESEEQGNQWEFQDEDPAQQQDEQDSEQDPDAGGNFDAEVVIDTGDVVEEMPEPDSGGDDDSGEDDEVFDVADDNDEEQPEPDVDPIQECGGDEVDTSQNPAHCGQCDNACDEVFGACEGGSCTCPDGFEACGQDNRCEFIEEDPSHCGGCGVTCGPGEACQGGECVCRSGFTECGGECVDTDRDPNHCGGCDDNCGLGSCNDGNCESGGCSLASSFECEPEDADGLSCMPWDGASNSLYCNPSIGDSCGEVCDGNQVCRPFVGCRSYRAARGCDGCPCDDCSLEERCFDDISSMDGVYCMSRLDSDDDDDDGWF